MERATPKQQDFLADLIRDCYLTAEEQRTYYLKKTGRVILSLSDLSRQEISTMINELKVRRDHLRCKYTPPSIGIETQSVPPEGKELVYETTGPPPWD